MPGGLPPPSTDALGEPAPETGLIVKFDAATAIWKDQLGRDWSQAVRFSLPDEDVFAIDATSLAETAVFTHVGTTLFNMAVNPVSGTVYVSNTEAVNEVRFEGPGTFGGSTVQGHLAEARITVLDGASVLPRHLNKHIHYEFTPAPIGRQGPQPGDTDRDGDHAGRDHALRRGVRLVAHRRFRYHRARGRHVRPDAGERVLPDGERRRAERRRPRPGARAALRADAFRQRGVGRRPGRRDRNGAPPASQPRADRAS